MTHSHVGEMIRLWRRKRHLSQQTLAEVAEVSTRHLSCVETGKAQPSREMLLVLGNALELPLRERNLLLMAGGHPAAYRQEGHDPNLTKVVQLILDSADPNPAVAADITYRLVGANRSMAALAMWLGVPLEANIVRSVFTTLRPFLVNYEAIAAATINRLHRELLHTGHPDLEALYAEVRHLAPPPSWDIPPIAVPVTLAKDGIELRLVTTLTSLGTPTDVTASELRIETYYPMDDASREALDSLTRIPST